MTRRVLAFVVALAVGYVLAAIAATQFVLGEIVALGLPVPLLTRLSTTVQDIVGMSKLYLPILGAGFLLAFALTGLLLVWLGQRHRTVLYVFAGASAVVAVNLIMKAVFEITPIAGARSILGLAAQAIAGATAGYTFAIVSLPHAPSKTS